MVFVFGPASATGQRIAPGHTSSRFTVAFVRLSSMIAQGRISRNIESSQISSRRVAKQPQWRMGSGEDPTRQNRFQRFLVLGAQSAKCVSTDDRIELGGEASQSPAAMNEKCLLAGFGGMGFGIRCARFLASPDEVKLVSKRKPKREPSCPPNDPSFPEWLKGRLRFGLADDCVILFVPSHARDKKRITDQAEWASQALELMGKLYGGATGFPNLRGIWRDDDNDGELLDDEPIMIQSLALREDVADPEKVAELGSFLKRMGKTTRQAAVAVVINNAIHFISNYD